MPKKLPIWDQRMLLLMDHCISHKIKGITSEGNFLKKVGINSISTLTQIRNGKQSFRHIHLLKAANLLDINMNWLYGFSDTMKRNVETGTVEDLLQQALAQLKNKKLR